MRPPDDPTADSEPPARRRRLRLAHVLALLTAPGFASAIAAHLPFRHWLIDLPAGFPVQAGAALLLGTVALLATRRFRLAVVWLAGALLAAAAVLPGWLAAPAAVAPAAGAGRSLTVLSLNLQKDRERFADAALQRVRDSGADVVFLAEVTPAWQQRLEPALATEYPYRVVAADPGYFGVALFSRLPLAAAPIALGYAWAPALRGVVETAAGPVGVLGVHPPRPGTGARCHERDTALAAIPAVVADMPERRIVLGDFNATPWNAAFRALLANTGLRHANGTGFHPTWHTKLPWPLRIPIDHVMVDGLGVVATEVGASFGSDHAPLLARLSF